MQNDKISETLAVNTGNMIASLNLQVAQLQTAHQEQEEEINKLRAQNQELRIRIQNLTKRKGDNNIEPLHNHATNK